MLTSIKKHLVVTMTFWMMPVGLGLVASFEAEAQQSLDGRFEFRGAIVSSSQNGGDGVAMVRDLGTGAMLTVRMNEYLDEEKTLLVEAIGLKQVTVNRHGERIVLARQPFPESSGSYSSASSSPSYGDEEGDPLSGSESSYSDYVQGGFRDGSGYDPVNVEDDEYREAPYEPLPVPGGDFEDPFGDQKVFDEDWQGFTE